MESPSHIPSYLTPYPSNGKTIEPSVLLCYFFYVHTFIHKNSYDLGLSGGRKSEIAEYLCLETCIPVKDVLC